jgi:hypothetical protein
VRSFLDAYESETAAAQSYGFEVEPPAVVCDGELDVLTNSGERDGEPARSTMYHPVLQRLLSDSKQRHRGVRGQVSKVALGIEAYVNIMPLFDLAAQGLQRLAEAEQS